MIELKLLIAEHQLVAAGDDGRIRLDDAKLLEELVHLGGGFQVDPGEELLQLRANTKSAEAIL